MSRRPIIVSFVLALIIVVAGMLGLKKLIDTVQVPLERTVTKVYANQTLESIAKVTQAAIDFERTKTAEYQDYIYKQTQTQNAWNMAATAAITPTPDIKHVCEAHVSSYNAYGLPEPGNNPNQAEHYTVEMGRPLQVRAKLIGMSSWLLVQSGGEEFFMKPEHITFNEPNCYDGLKEVHIHYAAQYLPDDNWRLVLEDAFTLDEHAWKEATSRGLIPTESDGDERFLSVKSIKKNTEFYTKSLDERDFRAFEMNFNSEIIRPDTNGYLSVKFFINDDGFYEFRFFPYDCNYIILNQGLETHGGEIGVNLCRDFKDFQVKLRVNEEGQLTLKINGVEKSPITLESTGNRPITGKIHFVVNNLYVKFNYIVVTAPEE